MTRGIDCVDTGGSSLSSCYVCLEEECNSTANDTLGGFCLLIPHKDTSFLLGFTPVGLDRMLLESAPSCAEFACAESRGVCTLCLLDSFS